jgi:PTH1 family peptidyl-tRNA hydrolase
VKLIVGLGNPGKRYVNNRHNVGFRCLDHYARRQGITFNHRRARSKIGTGEVVGTKVALAKPRTFMNLSGEAVATLVRHYHISRGDLIIIYDDLDIPLGKIRIRERGSSGGHKGVKSIISKLGGQDFPRIRVGIAPLDVRADTLFRETDTIEYVLSDFTAKEKTVVKEVYSEVADAVDCIITEGVTAAMNRFN